VETVIALGLLAGILISISGLFLLGARQVRSGKTGSAALALGRTILEEMGRWSLKQSYEVFGYDGSAPGYTVDTRTHTDAITARWRSLVPSILPNGHASVELLSLGPGSTPPAMASARAIRVRVTVSWDEGARHRTVQVATVKM
jgi:hypothetical protein